MLNPVVDCEQDDGTDRRQHAGRDQRPAHSAVAADATCASTRNVNAMPYIMTGASQLAAAALEAIPATTAIVIKTPPE